LGTALLVAGDPALAVDVGSGVLLDPDDESVTGELRAQLLVGRSCPDEHAVTAAVAEQVDLVVVGPDRLGELVAAAGDLPVLVRGEPAADELATWLEAGAHGVVVGASVMRAKAPAEVVADLLERLGGHSG
jgi:thiamine monophosphate synthase